jgi:hypothetical protein
MYFQYRGQIVFDRSPDDIPGHIEIVVNNFVTDVGLRLIYVPKVMPVERPAIFRGILGRAQALCNQLISNGLSVFASKTVAHPNNCRGSRLADDTCPQ